MRIASVTNTPLHSYLGSGKTVIEWSSGLRRLGHQVDVFTPDDFYRPFRFGRLRRLKMRLDSIRWMRRLIEGRYDLIECYGGEFGWLIARLASRPSRPVLVAHTNGLELLAHENEEAGSTSKLKRVLGWPMEKLLYECDRTSFTKADRFAAICKLDAEYVVSHGLQPEERTVVVEPGVDEEYLSAPWDQPKRHRIAYLGSWSERKDPATLTAVLHRLLDEDELLGFDLMGAWDDRDKVLRAFSPHLHPRVQVHLRLEKSQIAALLAQAKVFLFPSLYEGFGMATAEAMACGCAVVVTPTGFGGSLKDGVEALVRPRRDVEGMTAAVRQLLSDAKLRERISQAGRQRVVGMTWDCQVNRLETVYRRWCGA